MVGATPGADVGAVAGRGGVVGAGALSDLVVGVGRYQALTLAAATVIAIVPATWAGLSTVM